MRKNFVSNLVFLLFLNLLVKPFWILGIDRTVQNTVGPSDYGIYFALFNFAFLFQVVLDFGINNFNNRHIAQQPERLRDYFFTTLIAKLVFAVVYTLIVFIAAFGIRFNIDQLGILGLLILMQVLLSFYVFLRSNVAAMQLFKTDAVLSVLDKLITVILCSIVLWGHIPGVQITIENYIWMQIIGYVAACLIALFIVIRHTRHIRFTFKKDQVKEIIKKSLPYALLGFLMTVYYRVDAVMIERLSGENSSTETGIYASAFRLLDALSILGYLMAGILLPLFSRMLHNKENIQPLFDLSYKLMLVLSASAGISIICYRNEIMALLYTSGDVYSAQILGLLMISFICISLIYVFGSLLTANGNLRILNWISFTGLCVNVVINFILIPQHKALGASFATVCTQLAVLIAHMIAVHKHIGVRHQAKKWGQTMLYIGLLAGINLLVLQTPLPWALKFSIACIACFLLAIPAGLFRFKDIRHEVSVLLRRQAVE